MLIDRIESLELLLTWEHVYNKLTSSTVHLLNFHLRLLFTTPFQYAKLQS